MDLRRTLKIVGATMLGGLLTFMLVFGAQTLVKKAHASVIEDAKNATVFLMSCNEKNRCSTGTGFVVKQDTQGSFIITNKHVCLGALLSPEEKKLEGGVMSFRAIGIQRRDGTQSGGQILRVGQNSDLCLIRSELKFKSTLHLAHAVKQNEPLFSYGFPGGKPELNKGKYKGTDGMQYGFYSHTDMKVWFGASGSAILNVDGDVIGVMAMIRSSDPKSKKRELVIESLFIPLEILREFIGGK